MCSGLDGMSPFPGVLAPISPLLLSLKTGLDWEGSSLFIGMDALSLLIIHLWFLVQIYMYRSLSRSGFLSTIVVGECEEYCKTFSSVPVLHTLGVSKTLPDPRLRPSKRPPRCDTQSVSKHFQCALDGGVPLLLL